jgi:shikimate dehydrogenase
MKVDAETILCATIAYPNRTAKSPIMHNAGFEALGINYVYMAFEPKASALAGAFAGMRALEIRGFSVSKPYKETVIQYLDEVDDIARKIGAVNTILNDNGKLIGYNSDWIGAANGIEEVTPIQGKRVVIVGAGGAGRAIAYGLKEKGGNVVIYNRSKERAQQLSSELGIEFGGGLDEFQQLTDYDILINATSVGSVLDVENMVIPRHLLQKGKVVLDAVFSPTITRLVKEACEAGCHVVLGIRMLVLQGAFQFKLFTGYDPPLDVMQKVLEKSLAK